MLLIIPIFKKLHVYVYNSSQHVDALEYVVLFDPYESVIVFNCVIDLHLENTVHFQYINCPGFI